MIYQRSHSVSLCNHKANVRILISLAANVLFSTWDYHPLTSHHVSLASLAGLFPRKIKAHEQNTHSQTPNPPLSTHRHRHISLYNWKLDPKSSISYPSSHLPPSTYLSTPPAIIQPRLPDLTYKNIAHLVRFKFQITTNHFFLVFSNSRAHLGHNFTKT